MNDLYTFLKGHAEEFHSVIQFNPHKERIIAIDLSKHNTALTKINFLSTGDLDQYIFAQLKKEKAKLGIGGYNEDRDIYARSEIFNSFKGGELDKHEIRRIHLGTDIWGEAGTKIFTPLGGMIHGVAFNDNFGDYGATIIMQHQLKTRVFYILYGHLSLESIAVFKAGNYLARGEQVGTFGQPDDNGNWPPHLHFQIINDIGNWQGDYPGVCSIEDKEKYLSNSPDPDCILGLNTFIS